MKQYCYVEINYFGTLECAILDTQDRRVCYQASIINGKTIPYRHPSTHYTSHSHIASVLAGDAPSIRIVESDSLEELMSLVIADIL